MTTNNPLSNQEPLEPSQQHEHRVNFRNAEHELHIQLFYAWLHPDLRDLPGIDWAEMPGTVTSYLLNAVGDSPYAPHIALAIGTALGSFASITLRRFAASLNTLLNTVRTHCDSWNGIDLTREVWEEYLTRTTNVSKRRNCLLAYATLTERYIVGFVECLDSEQRRRVSPYILPPLPAYFLDQYGSNAAASVAELQRRKERNAVLASLSSLLVVLIQLRKQAVQRLLHEFREACYRAKSGEALPFEFSYEAVLPEINRDVRSAEEVQVEERRAILRFKLWNQEAWIEQYPDDMLGFTHRDAKGSSRGDDRLERQQYFAQYLGQASELLWFGDLVEHSVLLRLHGLGQHSHSEDLGKENLRRLAYAHALGVPQGFATERPGLLTPGGVLEEWLGRTIRRSGAVIFDPESLYRGCLFGAALATLTLTNGSRVTELLQVSADRFKCHPVEEKKNGQLKEKQPVIWFQHLLPKGKKSEEERQLFPISPQSYELLCEIGDLLKETYGCIPLVHPNTRNPKAAELKPERYLFQWQATSDGLHGAINPTDVQILIRFILHGLEIIPPLGEPFNISAHLLRHMVATATWLRHKDPSQVNAFILHHQSVPPTTEYYS